MRRRARPPAFVRPALLEALLVLTLTAVAAVTALAGFRLQCTALAELGILSAITAASAAALFARYAAQICGLLANYAQLELWGSRARVVCYIGLGLYALFNGILDIVLPRRDNDPISYPGLICAVVAVCVVAMVLESKYRVLQSLPSRSLFDSLSDDTFYLTVAVITLLALIGHVFAPSWWLDTAIDAVFVLLIALRLGGLRQTDLTAA